MTTVWYQDEILYFIVKLYAAKVRPSFVLMNIKARRHRADIVDVFLEVGGITGIE